MLGKIPEKPKPKKPEPSGEFPEKPKPKKSEPSEN